MTETTPMTEEEIRAELPPLAASITDQLTNLCAHAHTHGEHCGRTGEDPGAEMPECLADHVGALGAVLFGLTRPEEAESTITGTVEVPIELPEGLIEDVQKAVGEALEKIGKQS